MSKYYIASPKHTSTRDSWLTFWRTGKSGYCWRLDWAGTYDLEVAMDICQESNGDCVMVPEEKIEQWKAKAMYDGKEVEVVPNDRQTQRAFGISVKNMKPARTASC